MNGGRGKLLSGDTFKSCQDPFDMTEEEEKKGNFVMIDTTSGKNNNAADPAIEEEKS